MSARDRLERSAVALCCLNHSENWQRHLIILCSLFVKLAVTGNNARVAFYDVATGARKLRPKQPRQPALPDQFAALSLSFQIGGPSARRKRASAKFSPRATSRAAVVTPDDKENAPAPFSAEVSAAPFSAELAAGVSDGSECKQS